MVASLMVLLLSASNEGLHNEKMLCVFITERCIVDVNCLNGMIGGTKQAGKDKHCNKKIPFQYHNFVN